MKILIVGSKGFIGSSLLNYLSDHPNHKVWGCDIIKDNDSLNYFCIDGSNNYEIIFQQNEFDICINCSGAASVPESLINPQNDFVLNTVNVFKLLDAIKKNTPDCKFLNISSAAVYGNPISFPIKESNILQPLSPYGRHKMMAENICEEFYNFYNIKTCSARIFSAYGSGLKKQLFWDIAQRSKGAHQLLLYGTGNESRDFIHVLDIAKAIALIITKGDFNACQYNIANGIETTIKEASEILLTSLNWQGNLMFDGYSREGDPINWKADISQITKLGFHQTIKIEEGLNNYAEWLRKERLV